MRRILPAEFRIVDGTMWWPLAHLHAQNNGVLMPDDPPRCIAALSAAGGWHASVGVIECGQLLMFRPRCATPRSRR
jgi:hypothetical protein